MLENCKATFFMRRRSTDARNRIFVLSSSTNSSSWLKSLESQYKTKENTLFFFLYLSACLCVGICDYSEVKYIQDWKSLKV